MSLLTGILQKYKPRLARKGSSDLRELRGRTGSFFNHLPAMSCHPRRLQSAKLKALITGEVFQVVQFQADKTQRVISKDTS